MITFQELYEKLLSASVQGKLNENINKNIDFYDKDQLDCLLHPKKHPVVWKLGKCDCSPDNQKDCVSVCQFDAMGIDKDGVSIDNTNCVGCYDCIDNCKKEKLVASRDIIATLEAMKKSKGLVYAMIAPAFFRSV